MKFPAFLLLLLVAFRAPAGDFQAGASAVVITPPPGTPMAGYYHLRTAEGVLDDLFAKSLVVEQDGAKAAFVTLDLITVTRSIVLAARELIEQESGIPAERVMISATHSHTGPVLARGSARDESDGGAAQLTREYGNKLPALIAQSVAQANARLTPAHASATVGREESLSFNRRFWMQDGTVAWNPPKLDPRILAPAGPSDADVGLLYLRTTAKEQAPIAAYVNFAMHPDVVGGLRFSADYPGCLCRRLAEYKGAGLVTLFANGCCGNLNHRNVWWSERQGGVAEAERIGTVLAGAVLRSWPQLAELGTFPPRARTTLVRLERPTFSEAEVAEARALADRLSDPKLGTVVKAKAVCILDTAARQGTPLEVEVQAIAFSDQLAIVALPGEMFVELGLALKKASPFRHTFIAELANGSIGYIPNRSAYAEGNYEVVSARCAAGSGEALIEAALGLLRGLRSGADR